ncbi:CHAT domain-containing protein [Candidatus Amarobacter glycogenicus]|uniref:CHAT domain-containing protein n=1 Tax=Candidatus Amarobacter glycogenicus TaxID=3140699 RepID=UPI0031CCB072
MALREEETRGLFGLAVSVWNTGERAEFPDLIEQGLQAFERARKGRSFGSERNSFQVEWAGLMTVATLLLCGNGDKLAWKVEQALKARSLDEENRAMEHLQIVYTDELRQAEHLVYRLRDQLENNSFSMLIRASFEDGFATSAEDREAERERKRRALREAEERFDRLFEATLQRSPELRSLDPGKLPSVGDVQSVLRPGETYVGFVWHEDHGLARLVLPAAGPLQVEAVQDEAFEELSAVITKATEFHGQSGRWELPSELGKRLVGELPAGTQRIIYSPHGPLTLLPLHLLEVTVAGNVRPGRLPSVVVPSISMLVRLREEAPEERAHPYVGAAHNPGPGRGDIPGVIAEVKKVYEHYFPQSAQPFLDPETGRLFGQAGTTRVLHLACHASPHGLLLNYGDDGWCTPAEFRALGWRCDLLLLTGCSTGRLNDEEGTNEFSGVVRLLMAVTGAKAVVLSRDPVVDAAGVLFADGLFAALTGKPSWSTTPSWTLTNPTTGEARGVTGQAAVRT